MLTGALRGAWLLALVSSAPVGVVSAAADAPDSGQQALIRELVAAVNARDGAAQQRLVHSSVAACITDATRPLFEDIFARERRQSIPPSYRASVKPMGPSEPLLFEDLLRYPVRPTHVLTLDFARDARSSTSMIRYLARDGAGWRVVVGCPGPEAMAKFHEGRREAAEQQDRARKLAAEVSAPLRAELVARLRAGRRIDAIKRYQEVAPVDLATARQVTDLLDPDRRD
jgi:hypothetical protein